MTDGITAMVLVRRQLAVVAGTATTSAGLGKNKSVIFLVLALSQLYA